MYKGVDYYLIIVTSCRHINRKGYCHLQCNRVTVGVLLGQLTYCASLEIQTLSPREHTFTIDIRNLLPA